jgi:diguanylate cyclase (GGDEF)-like protein
MLHTLFRQNGLRPTSSAGDQLAERHSFLFRDGARGAGLMAVGGLLIAGIAAVDLCTGPYLSFATFYIIPVAVCAWWGGFTHGLLASIGVAVAWQLVDAAEGPDVPTFVLLWNSIARFSTLVLVSSLVARLHTSVLRERVLARVDPLTGAANGRTFYECVAAEAERARRADKPLTLAYVDLDNFKQLNDRLGHAVGDAALVEVVRVLRDHLRVNDLLARLGGDEFAILLPETDAGGAMALLLRLQELVAAAMRARDWPVTASIGAASFLKPPRDVDLMVQRVDALMYRAKRQGKARVEFVVENVEIVPEKSDRPAVERRVTARLLSGRLARVWQEGEEVALALYATVCDISDDGIAVSLDRRFEQDAVLVIEPLFPGTKTLLVSVVRSFSKHGAWVHGCRFNPRLTAEELAAWRGEGGDAVPIPPPGDGAERAASDVVGAPG